MCCHTIIVMLGTMEHDTARSKMSYHHSVTLPFATNSALTISQAAIKILEKLFAENEGLLFKKAGVIVTQLSNENEKQFDLFEDENPKHLSLMKTIDNLNKKMGGRKIRFAAQDNKTWNMRQDKLSPSYTTQFDQIFTIDVDKQA